MATTVPAYGPQLRCRAQAVTPTDGAKHCLEAPDHGRPERATTMSSAGQSTPVVGPPNRGDRVDEHLEEVHSLYWEGQPLKLLALGLGTTPPRLLQSFANAGMPVNRPGSLPTERESPSPVRRQRSSRRTTADPRVPAMYRLYEKGATLDEVGKAFGISKERVSQLFRRSGLSARSIREAAALKRNQAEARANEIRAAYDDLGDYGATAVKLGLSRATVEDILEEDEPIRSRAPAPRPGKKRYSNEDLLSCLRETSEAIGGVLGVADYNNYAKGRTFRDGRPWPTNQTFQLRYGSWRDALLAAGLAANPSTPIAGQRIFSEAHCIDALRHARRELGKVPTSHAYDRLARESQGALPSLATVRNRLGGWSDSLKASRDLVAAGFDYGRPLIGRRRPSRVRQDRARSNDDELEGDGRTIATHRITSWRANMPPDGEPG